MKNVNMYVYTEYTGSFSKGSGSYHVILETMVSTPKGQEPATLKKIKVFEDVTKNKLALLAVEEGFSHLKKPCHVCIYIDSDYIFAAFMQNWLIKWADNGFRSNGKLVKYADTWSHVSFMTVPHEIEVIKADSTSYSKAQAVELKIYKESH